MRIKLSVDSVVYYSAVAAVSYVSMAVAQPTYIQAVAVDTPKLIFFDPSGSGQAFGTLPQTFLPAETVFISDLDEAAFEIDLVKGAADSEEADQVAPEDSDPVFNMGKVLDDSVSAVESRVFVFTDFIDTIPADDAVDPDPVTIVEADAKDITVGELADDDDVIVGEATAKNPSKPGITDVVAASEAIDDFDIGKNPSDTATASEAIDRFDVTTEFNDTVTATEALAKDYTQISDDSVTAVQSNIKTFTSNVDFDLSDADVDPDPVTPSDAIDDFDVNKGLTDAVTAAEADVKDITVGELADNDTVALTETDAKEFTFGGLTDSLSAVEGIKNNPAIVKTDAVAMAESNTFDVRPEHDDSVTATEALDSFDIDLVKTDTVNVSDVSVKNFTQDVDFDRSDADADADPVTMSEVLAYNSTKPLTDSVSPIEAAVFNFTAVYSDTATATESIATLLTLGESEFVYPDFVSVSDGYRRFVEEPYAYNISGTDYYVPYTGVIGMAETVNTVMLANDRVTAPDTSSAGLAVNFHYTDVDEDDRALGGYYFNQTPLNPGNSTVGQRAIL